MDEEKHTGEKKPSPSSTLRILLIEDSDTDAFLIERALEKYMKNTKCTRATTLKEGEAILQKNETDLLLLDLGLPDTADASDTYKRIKKWTSNIPVVIMTNLKDHDLARNMVHEGVADFVNKDMIGKDPKIVQNTIDFSLERHAQSKKLQQENKKATKESEEKDIILSCFMGGYSILKDK
jgi:DNA-binding NtrC family response regulator